MPSVIQLYHGSERIIEKPQWGLGKPHNDYGQGFYCTESENLASEWACSSLSGGFVNRYAFDMTDLRVLRLNDPEYSILHWITFLISYRLFRVRTPIAGHGIRFLQEHYSVNVNAYDVVIGYRADDSYYDFADAFLNNGITVEQLSQAMKLGKLGEQVVLKSPLAFERIRFEGYAQAEGTVWYPLRSQRNEKAQQAYLSLASEVAEGTYLADLIRGERRD